MRSEIKNTEVFKNSISQPEIITRNDLTQDSVEFLHGRKKETDLLICMDSNFKYINYRKLWTINKSERKSCSNLNDVENVIKDTDITTLHHILISTGVNDLDDKSGLEVFNKICHIIYQIKVKYPGIKIIFCEVTPRNDERDEEVIRCNQMVNAYVSTQENIYIAHHSNLRDETYSLFRDNKHIKEYKIAKYASNIKRALRAAYGIQPTNSRERTLNKSYQPHNSNTYQSYSNVYQPRQDNTTSTRPGFLQMKPDISSRLQDIANNDSGEHINRNANPNDIILKHKIVEAFTQSMNSVFGN